MSFGAAAANSAGAEAAFYHQIPVAHVEAGLRTFDNESFLLHISKFIINIIK